MISSIFPEKIYFSENKCRTQRINEVLSRILFINKGLEENKNGQPYQNLELSTLVESERIELSSKQAIKKLSTCLVIV